MSFRHHRRRCRPHQQHHRFGLLLALSSLTSIDRTTAAPKRTARVAQLGQMTKKQPKIRMKTILKLTDYATYACNNLTNLRMQSPEMECFESAEIGLKLFLSNHITLT